MMKNGHQEHLRMLLATLAASWILSAQNTESLAMQAARRRFEDVHLTVNARPRFGGLAVSKGLTDTLNNPKIDSSLRDLLTRRSANGPENSAASAPVAIEVLAQDASGTSVVRQAILENGGQVTGILDNSIEARVPIASLKTLADMAAVYAIGAQVGATLDRFPETASQLADPVSVDHLHAAGIDGRNIRIGVIDFGFSGLDELVRSGKLKEPADQHVFGEGKLAQTEKHGTQCLALIQKLAPAAEVYVAAAGPDRISIQEAARYLINKGATIISFSGGFIEGPRDGRSSFDTFVDEAVVKNGVLWVNSVGNFAQNHWTGTTNDRDSGGWIKFDHTVRDAGSKRELLLKTSGDGAAVITVLWDDWGPDPERPAARQPVNAFLFSEADNQKPHLFVSRPFNFLGLNNLVGARPIARFYLGDQESDVYYALSISAPDAKPGMRIHVFTKGFSEVFPYSPQRSLQIPATSHSVLSVGAVRMGSNVYEDFSSRGPTDDGRAKPETAAVDGINLISGPFWGTSASAPAAAGFAALLQQIKPRLRGEALRNEVLKYTTGGLKTIDASLVPIPEIGLAAQPKLRQTITLPQELGGSISIESFKRLERCSAELHAFPTQIAVGRLGVPAVYRSHEGLKFAYRSTSPAFCTVVRRDPKGDYQVLVAGSAKLAASRSYVYPPSETETIPVPQGDSQLLFLCSRKELNLEDMARDQWQQLKSLISINIVEYRGVK